MADRGNMDALGRGRLACLVADSGAFIRNVPLDAFSEKILTISDVVDEIRDSQARQRLAVLPYEIHFREPAAEFVKFGVSKHLHPVTWNVCTTSSTITELHLGTPTDSLSFTLITSKHVTEFSKKTGDFKSLSAVDIRVLALVCQLEKEFCNASHIKEEPTKKTVVVPKSRLLPEHQIAGFFQSGKRSVASEDNILREQDVFVGNPPLEHAPSSVTESLLDSNTCPVAQEDRIHDNVTDDKQVHDEDMNLVDADDEDGWITPGNVQDMKRKMGINDTEIDSTHVKCGCVTMDFAMQNVLIQMGLHVISVDGRLIREARSYIQKCYGCNKETHDMERMFCPCCGNKTLLKVAVTVEADGTIQYHYPTRRRNINIRGTKFSIPLPKGGRRAEEVILCEDQKTHHSVLPKQKDIMNPLDPDYVARESPFVVKDTNSRAFNRGIHLKGARTKNPNQNVRKSSKRQ